MTHSTGVAANAMIPEGRISRRFKIAFLLLLIPGILVFVDGALRRGDLRIWQVYLVNLLFWMGFSQAGVVISALNRVTNAKWDGNIRYLMEALTAFSPVAFLLFIVLFLGSSTIFPWVTEAIAEKEMWLNITGLFVREAFNVLVLNVLNLVFLYYSFRPDVGRLIDQGSRPAGKLLGRLVVDWKGYELERVRSKEVLQTLAPVILIVYTLVYSIMAFDLIMSLEPSWYSSLFGAYYFMTNLYMGLAGITLVIIVCSYAFKLEGYVTKSHYHDLGKLMLAFCLISLDFFWSQYLVIWYGNMPEEISFLVVRINDSRWLPLTVVVLAACFVLPFILLLSRGFKTQPLSLLPVALLIFASIWLERYVLVVPSIWHGDRVPLGLPEIAITLSFLSAFVLCYVAFVEKFPILPSDAQKV